MTTIRRFEHADLPAAAALMRERLPGRTADEGFLASTLLDHPWAESEVGPLAAEDETGEVIGFVGVQARRLRLGDEEIGGALCSHLVVADRPGTGPAGALLLAKLLAGPQAVTWSDTASDAVVRMWQSYGGHADQARACDWMLVLRPARWVAGAVAGLARRERGGREAVPVGALPFHAAGARLVPRAHPESDPTVTSEPACPEAIAKELPALTTKLKLYVDHDAAYLAYLFERIRAFWGEPRVRIVRRRGAAVGWYAYVPARGGVSRLLHLLAREREAEAALGAVVADARASGSAVLAGRLEPHLAEPLRARMAAIGLARRPVIHFDDPAFGALLATRSALLTQLDGEWYAT